MRSAGRAKQLAQWSQTSVLLRRSPRELAATEARWALVGVDALLPALERAHESVPGAHLFHASAEDLPFGDETVDALVAVMCSSTSLTTEALCANSVACLGRVAARSRRSLEPAAVRRLRRLSSGMSGASRGVLRRRAHEANLDPVQTRYVRTMVSPGFWVVKTYGRMRHGAETTQGGAIVSARIRRDAEVAPGDFGASDSRAFEPARGWPAVWNSRTCCLPAPLDRAAAGRPHAYPVCAQRHRRRRLPVRDNAAPCRRRSLPARRGAAHSLP